MSDLTEALRGVRDTYEPVTHPMRRVINDVLVGVEQQDALIRELVAALAKAEKRMLYDDDMSEAERGQCRSPAEVEAAGDLPEEIMQARAALAKAKAAEYSS